MFQKLYLCHLFYLLLLLCNISQSAGVEGWKIYEEEFQSAQNSLEIMTPGFFSVNLSKTLQKLSSKGVHIRILMDSTYLTDPTNTIGNLKDNLSVRILEDHRQIPVTTVIIDR